jgi:hypothetical protein
MNPREGTNHDEDFILNLAAMLLMPLVSLHAAEVANLRCEYLKDPLGIDVAKPRLGWKIVISDQPSFPRPPVRSPAFPTAFTRKANSLAVSKCRTAGYPAAPINRSMKFRFPGQSTSATRGRVAPLRCIAMKIAAKVH